MTSGNTATMTSGLATPARPVSRAALVSRTEAPARAARGQEQPLRVAYMMSRFPKLTETFILFEIQALEKAGTQVEIFPLWRERAAVIHDEARPYMSRVHFRRLLSARVLSANLKYLFTSPRRYLSALRVGLRANWGSRRYWLGFVAAFPKAVAFAHEMQRAGIQHIHAHFASHPAAAAFVIHRLTGIPFSFTAHGSDLHRDVHMLREKVADAAFVVAISQYNREVIARECGADGASKVQVIHCGTDTRVFRPEASKAARPAGRPFQVACIGTLHEVKGQRYAIAACRLLHTRGVQVQLHLVGDGPDAGELKALVRHHGLEGQVVFHGSRPRREVARLLQQVDAVMAPSVPTRDGRREGIPVALMEAMASGLPVVASAISGIPELVRDRVNGRLVPPRESDQLAEALEELARKPELCAQWGRAARETVEQSFDLHLNAAELLREIRGSAAIHADASGRGDACDP